MSANLPNPNMNFDPFVAPTSAQMDDLVENVESLADGSGLDDGAINGRQIDWAKTGDGGLWYEELDRATLLSAADVITVTNLPERKYLRIIMHILATGGTAQILLRFNNDSASNYSRRASVNGGADATALSGTNSVSIGAASNVRFLVLDIINDEADAKLVTGYCIDANSVGAASVPGREERVGKWANTANPITRIDVVNSDGTGDYAIGSEVIVLGHN